MEKRYYYIYNTDKDVMAVLDIINLDARQPRHYKTLNKGNNYSGDTETDPKFWAKEYTKVSFSEYSKQTGITIKDLLV